MSESKRSIELAVEVSGTPEEVWRAIATGPGISSWYVPHVVEEREGGAALASFGDAPEMQIPGRVAVWEPPRRIVFDGGEDAGGLAFEWLVEPKDGETCIVRLVNSGFGDGAEWDGQYDGMADGWQLFMFNLQLHCRHFLGQAAVSMLPMVTTSLPREDAWAKLCAALQIAEAPVVGEQIVANGDNGLRVAGTVVRVRPNAIGLLLDEPSPGTAFLAAEGGSEGCAVSVWSYLYGADAQVNIDRDKPRWQSWLDLWVNNSSQHEEGGR
jgi:uncharacterized protein YndB with AHSA1/START domain